MEKKLESKRKELDEVNVQLQKKRDQIRIFVI